MINTYKDIEHNKIIQRGNDLQHLITEKGKELLTERMDFHTREKLLITNINAYKEMYAGVEKTLIEEWKRDVAELRTNLKVGDLLPKEMLIKLKYYGGSNTPLTYHSSNPENDISFNELDGGNINIDDNIMDCKISNDYVTWEHKFIFDRVIIIKNDVDCIEDGSYVVTIKFCSLYTNSYITVTFFISGEM